MLEVLGYVIVGGVGLLLLGFVGLCILDPEALQRGAKR